MTGWLWRALVLAAGVWAGFWCGRSVGSALGWDDVSPLVGAIAGAWASLALDAVTMTRLQRWLRNPEPAAAPRLYGPWRALGDSIQRSFRALRRQADAQRDELQQFLQAIEASPNGVLLLDENERIQWCSATAADHLDLELPRDLHQQVTHLVRAPAFVDQLQSGSWREPVICHLPGRAIRLAILVRPYGARRKLMLTQDVTENERTEAMKRDFVANVSHEIRSPLTVLAGFVETLRSLHLSSQEQARVLLLMQQQTDRMQSLVTDLLQLARLEGSPGPPLDHWVPLQPLLRRIETEARALSEGRHVLGFDDPGTVDAAAEESELHSAIGNLVQNAIRYTPDGGTISVALVSRAEGGAAIEVRDSGIGIAREHLPRLAERFYRVDRGRSRESGGTGLGLAIVRHVALRHGGELLIDSEPGKGSTFSIALPSRRLRGLAPPP